MDRNYNVLLLHRVRLLIYFRTLCNLGLFIIPFFTHPSDKLLICKLVATMGWGGKANQKPFVPIFANPALINTYTTSYVKVFHAYILCVDFRFHREADTWEYDRGRWQHRLLLFLPSATKLFQGNIFTPACDTVYGWVSGRHPVGRHPPGQTPPPRQTPPPG